jgi:hypothetical protein
MSWRFRKIFRFGRFRTTLSKKGWGFSWGLPGFRLGTTPDGRKYISIGIPYTGFYWIKYFDKKKKSIMQEDQKEKSNQIDKSNDQKEPWWKQKGLSE